MQWLRATRYGVATLERHPEFQSRKGPHPLVRPLCCSCTPTTMEQVKLPPQSQPGASSKEDRTEEGYHEEDRKKKFRRKEDRKGFRAVRCSD